MTALPLACRLGRHAPDPFARWNEGYYFARCRRCGTDLVRTAYGPWLKPKGFRVIWSSARPDSVLPVATQPDSPPREAPQRAVAAPARPKTYVPDFMDNAQTDTSWRRHGPQAKAGVEESQPAAAAVPAQSRADFARLIPPLRLGPSANAAEGQRPARRALVTIAVLVLIVLSIAVLVRASGVGAAPSRARPPVPNMYVSDRMTSCRAMPAEDADHVRYLVRGDAVRLVGREGGWAVVSYGGQQCWVLLDQLSDQPLP